MSSQQARRQPAQPSQVQALPLRSLTGLWVLLGVLGLGFVALAARGLAAPKARAAAGAGEAKGPTKEQVRERQEHIALTERALELARKERKATAQASAVPSGVPADAAVAVSPESAPAASAPRAGSTPAPTTARAASADAPASSAATAPTAAAPATPASKPAAATGLDEMRADITSAFE